MVKKSTVIIIAGIVGAFAVFGGTKLIKPAVENAKQNKKSLSQKINDIKKGAAQ